MEKLLNTRETAEKLGVSVWYVLDHTKGRKKPTLPCLKLGRNSRRFRPEDLAAFVESRKES
jgi:hypothetical protein